VGDLWVTRNCVIPEDELAWRFTGSGGPGGQHANTANTKAEVRFDIAGSAALGPRQKARLLEKLGPVVRVAASDRRSQAQNRALALERLRSRLADALRVEAPRHATKPTKGSQTRRVEAKRKRSDVKRARAARPTLDD
jgi:ribosome-associated protein